MYVSDHVRGTDQLWIVGDNFVAKSYRKHFKNMVLAKKEDTSDAATSQSGDDEYFIKQTFEVQAFCNSRYSSSQQNLLARLQNSMALGINSTNVLDKGCRLPKYVIVVLDDDLISFLQFNKEGAATLLGSWVLWLADEFSTLVKERKDQLPSKCKADPFFYWITAPTHQSFSRELNQLRIKYNLSLESVIRERKNMRVAKIKDIWDTKVRIQQEKGCYRRIFVF